MQSLTNIQFIQTVSSSISTPDTGFVTMFSSNGILYVKFSNGSISRLS